jgi:hypothetical protein
MTEAVPIYTLGESWSDAELSDNFLTQKPMKKVHLYGLLAKRSSENAVFAALLKKEVLSEENLQKVFFRVYKIRLASSVGSFGTWKRPSKGRAIQLVKCLGYP